ncbi:hypothetical protein PENTCL1PPCAC_19453, partial [Pristionchus entomophagus]
GYRTPSRSLRDSITSVEEVQDQLVKRREHFSFVLALQYDVVLLSVGGQVALDRHVKTRQCLLTVVGEREIDCRWQFATSRTLVVQFEFARDEHLVDGVSRVEADVELAVLLAQISGRRRLTLRLEVHRSLFGLELLDLHVGVVFTDRILRHLPLLGRLLFLWRSRAQLDVLRLLGHIRSGRRASITVITVSL